ncbi:MAG: hypothetical protein LBV53_00845 [Mycoplasmataceae bacterium]|nr:hypothetical protein [Mycoplasmataceae bacterium]
MFNLKKIFATISFEQNCIKVLVLDNTDAKLQYLFFDKVELDYSYDFSNIVNTHKIDSALKMLTTKVDNFIGMTINRYIVNIPFLNVEKNKYTSEIYDIENNICNDELKYKLLDSITIKDSEGDNVSFSTDIINWNLDGKISKEFPKNIFGNKLSYSYVSYFCNKVTISNIQNILHRNGINALSIVSNEHVAFGNQETLVWIDDNITSIYTNEKKTCLPFGINNITAGIKKDINVKDKFKLSSISHSLNSLCNIKHKVPVMNIYDDSYMSFITLTQKSLMLLTKKHAEILVKDIESEINKVAPNNNIIIMGSDIFHELANSKIEFNFKNKAEIINNNFSSLISYQNISSILSAYEYVYKKQLSCGKDIVYSIDQYIDQTLTINASKQNALLKFGIVSTNWAAKLG